MEEKTYKIIKDNYGFISHKREEYCGTVKELSEQLRYYLSGKKPRTINGLKKELDKYSRKHSTIYTSISFHIS